MEALQQLLQEWERWSAELLGGQVIESVELRLCFFRALLEDFNTRFGSDGYVAFIEIYAAAGCVLETLGIFKRLLVSAELSLSTFKLIAQLRSLYGIPVRVLSFHVGSRRSRGRWR